MCIEIHRKNIYFGINVDILVCHVACQTLGQMSKTHLDLSHDRVLFETLMLTVSDTHLLRLCLSRGQTASVHLSCDCGIQSEQSTPKSTYD